MNTSLISLLFFLLCLIIFYQFCLLCAEDLNFHMFVFILCFPVYNLLTREIILCRCDYSFSCFPSSLRFPALFVLCAFTAFLQIQSARCTQMSSLSCCECCCSQLGLESTIIYFPPNLHLQLQSSNSFSFFLLELFLLVSFSIPFPTSMFAASISCYICISSPNNRLLIVELFFSVELFDQDFSVCFCRNNQINHNS